MTPEEKITCNLSLKPMDFHELASLIRRSELHTMGILRRMREAGEIRVTGSGQYELIPDFDFPKGAA